MVPKWGEIILRESAIPGGEARERCLELPFAMEAAEPSRSGWVLDAGCALNGKLREVHPFKAQFIHVTQAIQGESDVNFFGAKVSYVLADLRDLSLFASGAFERVVCVSTLEHIGMDNRQYGGSLEANPESVKFAIRELCRVTRTRLFLTVPFSLTPDANERWRCFTPETLPPFQDASWRFYGATNEGGWYGGGEEPMTDCGTALKVNQIACLWAERS